MLTVCPECFDGFHSHCNGQGCDCRCNEPGEVDDDPIETILDDLQENYEDVGGEG